MSSAPQWETQLVPPPVLRRLPLVTQVPPAPVLPAAGSSVPATAACHSPFVINLLPDAAHADWAWNQVRYRDGVTPETEHAYKGALKLP